MRLPYSDHLVALVCQAEAAATRLAGTDAAARRALAAGSRRESGRLSARLDASSLADATADAVDAREAAGLPPVDSLPAAAASTSSGQGWAAALRIDQLPTQEVAAVEYANLLACFDVEAEVAGAFFDRPREVLVELHRVICRGLVADEVAGRLRRTDQAVHDGAQGRMLYRPPAPAALEGLLAGLESWITGPAGAKPPLVAAGVVHERLLQWHLFEAGNGRLARAASRVVLRATGLDPDGVAVSERLHAHDPTSYHAQVAAVIRRRDDLGPWLEGAAEAVVAGLDAAADALALTARPEVPARAEVVAATLTTGQVITVVEYAERAGTTRAGARRDLHSLLRAGRVHLEPGTRGLRFRRC